MGLKESFKKDKDETLPVHNKAAETVKIEEPEPLEEEQTAWMRMVDRLQGGCSSVFDRHKSIFKWILISLLVLGVHIFVVFAIIHNAQKATAVIVLVCLGWVAAFVHFVYSPYVHKPLMSGVVEPAVKATEPAWGNFIVQVVTSLVVLAMILVFIVYDTWKEKERLVGLGGMVFFILLMWIISNNRLKIRWRPVCWGFFIQFIMGLLVLRWQAGSDAFEWFSNQIVIFLDYTNAGTVFVYGFLAEPPNICGMSGVFAFTSLQVVVYFGSIVALLYYYGIMQAVLKYMATFMQLTLGTTATESLNACACIFLGQSEAPLLIRPYLSKMTPSELHAIMTSGFSCIAGSLFAAYISFGACPKYLLSSTVMSAPGSLACAKILFPETEESQLKNVKDLELPQSEESTPLECISNGAVSAVELVMAIVANLIVFLALLAFIDASLEWLGELVGQGGWSLEFFFGYLFFPLAYVMGVTSDPNETLKVARLMGTKTALNEFIAYQQLGDLIQKGAITPRAQMIATYALCGFSNFSSIGIQLGILGGMVPEKKPLLAKIALRALLAGCISCFYTAALAGVLVSSPINCPVNSNSAGCFDVDYYQGLLSNASSTPPITTTAPSILAAINHTEF